VKETEQYVAEERSRLDAFNDGLKLREEAIAEHKQELVRHEVLVLPNAYIFLCSFYDPD
jgi:hypothetical protein